VCVSMCVPIKMICAPQAHRYVYSVCLCVRVGVSVSVDGCGWMVIVCSVRVFVGVLWYAGSLFMCMFTGFTNRHRLTDRQKDRIYTDKGTDTETRRTVRVPQIFSCSLF